jgi:hypothetical protein
MTTATHKISSKERKQLIEASDQAVKDFAEDLGYLVDAVLQKNRKDNLMSDMKNLFDLVRKENPIGLIEIAGPYIWKYRDNISKQNVGFFLQNNFEEDIISAKKNKEIAEISNFEDIPMLLDQCKRTWHMFQKEEQQVLVKRVRNMLVKYATYVSATRTVRADI